MMSKETGGPAFPLADSCCEYGNTNRSDANGMTLRDYFAAKAMQAILSDPNYMQEDKKLAEASYAVADAMLTAREA